MLNNLIKKTYPTLDVSVFLAFTSIICLGFFLFFYAYSPTNEFITRMNFVLFCGLFVQTLLFILFGSKNPFALLIGFHLIFFFCPRAITLYFWDSRDQSAVLNRINDFEAIHLTDSLSIILILNIFILVGLLLSSKTEKQSLSTKTSQPPSQERILIAGICLFIIVFVASSLEFDRTSSVQGIVRYLFNRENVFYAISILFIVICGGKVSKKTAAIFFALIAFFILTNALGGSRKAIFNVIFGLWLILLLSGKTNYPMKYYLIFLAGIFGSILLYPYISNVRVLINADQIQSVTDYFVIPNHPKHIDTFFKVISYHYSTVFDRVSFLDFSIDTIKNADVYREIINLKYLFMSTVDGLTPGFDIFGKAKISNAIPHFYKEGTDVLSRINTSPYSSDQLTLYGMFYGLFGVGLSCFFLAVVFYLINYLWILASNMEQSFFNSLLQFVFLKSFVDFFNSFGLDWTIIYVALDLLSFGLIYCAIKLIENLINSTNRKNPKFFNSLRGG